MDILTTEQAKELITAGWVVTRELSIYDADLRDFGLEGYTIEATPAQFIVRNPAGEIVFCLDK